MHFHGTHGNDGAVGTVRGEVAEFRQRQQTISRAQSLPEVFPREDPNQTDSPGEAGLSPLQRVALAHYAEKVKTGNSVDDIDRLQDSLNRWEELHEQSSPPEMKPVLLLLKGKVRERLEELEAEARGGGGGALATRDPIRATRILRLNQLFFHSIPDWKNRNSPESREMAGRHGFEP